MGVVTTSNLTRFFRNPAHFKALAYFVIPAIVEKKRNQESRTLGIWSAGCSTGEEPYSVAMLCKEVLPQGIRLKIRATDVNLTSLNEAREGRYPASRLTDLPHRYRRRYFRRVPGGYKVCDELKETVTFDYHNLTDRPPLKGQDIVFCRNVLLHLDESAQKVVVERLWDAMDSHAYLFVSDSESLIGMSSAFESVKTEWTLLYRKPGA